MDLPRHEEQAMSLEEFRAWERKCLTEAVTNAARLLSRQSSAAEASRPGAEHGAAGEADTPRGADKDAPLKQKG
jgi:hypothetical protein